MEPTVVPILTAPVREVDVGDSNRHTDRSGPDLPNQSQRFRWLNQWGLFRE